MGLILVSPEGIDIADVKVRWQWYRWLAPKVSLLYWMLRLIYPFTRLLGLNKKVKQILQIRQNLRLNSTVNQILFRRRWAQIKHELLAENLGYLKVATLVLQGYKDTDITLSMSKYCAELLPRAKLSLISSGESNLPEQIPDIVVQKIIDFLSDEDNLL